MRALPFAVLLLILPAAAQPGPGDPPAPPSPDKAVAIEAVQLDWTGLEGESTFAYERRRQDAWQALGRFRLLQRAVDGSDQLELDDLLQVTTQDRQVELHAVQRCRRDALLSLVSGTIRLASKRGTEEQVDDVVLAVDGAQFVARVRDGEPRRRELPAGTISDMALLRLVTRLPAAAAVYRIGGLLELEDCDVRGGGLLECVGPAPLERGGETIGATLFRFWRGPRLTTELWVVGGQLERAVFDGTKRLERQGR